MRKIAFVTMVILAVVSVVEGHLGLALLFGGIKALLVGLGYMELTKAARPHAVAFTAFILALTGLLILIVSM